METQTEQLKKIAQALRAEALRQRSSFKATIIREQAEDVENILSRMPASSAEAFTIIRSFSYEPGYEA